jgi:tryptophanyl-tRNA synthetase
MSLTKGEYKGTILSGMRPTGQLHIGHLSVLENWAALQNDYRCYFMVADWHALTTAFDDTTAIPTNTQNVLLDWLAAGLDPAKATIFIQSHVKEHGELALLLGMNTPLAWLERVPSFKDQIKQLGDQGKDINTYGFLGYPLLMAADILVYRADTVPVGEDQIPHLEFTREIGRRFNHLYQVDLFPDAKAKLAKIAALPGVDGRKMSKSYHNDIALSAPQADVEQKVRNMITDPARIRKTDPGHPEVCTVYTYQKIYNEGASQEIEAACRGGQMGCTDCKKSLAASINAKLEPIRQRRKYYEHNPQLVKEIVATGDAQARQAAGQTLALVRDAMHLNDAFSL